MRDSPYIEMDEELQAQRPIPKGAVRLTEPRIPVMSGVEHGANQSDWYILKQKLTEAETMADKIEDKAAQVEPKAKNELAETAFDLASRIVSGAGESFGELTAESPDALKNWAMAMVDKFSQVVSLLDMASASPEEAPEDSPPEEMPPEAVEEEFAMSKDEWVALQQRIKDLEKGMEMTTDRLAKTILKEDYESHMGRIVARLEARQ